MNKIWYQEMGFFNNPFSIKPAAFCNELFGNASVVGRIIKRARDSGFVFISGDFGAGKTTVLKKIIGEFRGGSLGGRKVIYYNCNRSERSIDYDRLLVDAGGFFGRIFGVKRRGMMLLLDEMQDMNKADLEMVKRYYDDGFFRSVVFVSKDDDVELSEELEKELDGNRFVLGDMSRGDAVKMVRERIGSLKFLGDDMILKIFMRDKNSRNFLKNCEDVCRVAFEGKADEVSLEHVEKVLG